MRYICSGLIGFLLVSFHAQLGITMPLAFVLAAMVGFIFGLI